MLVYSDYRFTWFYFLQEKVGNRENSRHPEIMVIHYYAGKPQKNASGGANVVHYFFRLRPVFWCSAYQAD